MAEIQATNKIFSQLKDAVHSGNLDSAESLLSKLKIAMVKWTSLPPLFKKTPNAEQELILARDIWEHAALLAVKSQDEAAFERSYLQLRNYYIDARPLLPKSSSEQLVVGLNLLRLLVQNRIAEFHTELELLSPEGGRQAWRTHIALAHHVRQLQENVAKQAQVHVSKPVQLAVQLEQWLMEGAYNKVLEARTNVPDQSYAYFMEKLLDTIREEIASCSEKAYSHLSAADAKRFLFCSTDQELADYARERGWTLSDGQIHFKDDNAKEDVSAMQVINNSLTYARELERIV